MSALYESWDTLVQNLGCTGHQYEGVGYPGTKRGIPDISLGPRYKAWDISNISLALGSEPLNISHISLVLWYKDGGAQGGPGG